MIEPADIIIELMDEMGWEYIPELEPTTFRSVYIERKLLFEKKPSEIDGSYEIENGIYVTPGGLKAKRFKILGREVSWGSNSDKKTVDLADPDSLKEIVSYVNR